MVYLISLPVSGGGKIANDLSFAQPACLGYNFINFYRNFVNDLHRLQVLHNNWHNPFVAKTDRLSPGKKD
jgi:hypothetical protein